MFNVEFLPVAGGDRREIHRFGEVGVVCLFIAVSWDYLIVVVVIYQKCSPDNGTTRGSNYRQSSIEALNNSR